MAKQQRSKKAKRSNRTVSYGKEHKVQRTMISDKHRTLHKRNRQTLLNISMECVLG
jgi:hypothetical protein